MRKSEAHDDCSHTFRTGVGCDQRRQRRESDRHLCQYTVIGP